MTAFTLSVPPAVEPVLLADVVAQARVDTTADNTLLNYLITGARQWAERYTGRAFITQTWQMYLDAAPGVDELLWWDGLRTGATIGPLTGVGAMRRYVALPRPPLQSVTLVQSFDDSDNPTTWDPSNYFVDTAREPGRLALRTGAVWPNPSRRTNGLLIEYVAGYGADGTTVPEPIKTAIRQLVSHWYEHRGEAATAPSTRGAVIMPTVPVPMVIQTVLDSYRVRYVGV